MKVYGLFSTGYVHVNIYRIRGSRLLFVLFCFVLREREQTIRFFARKEHAMFVSWYNRFIFSLSLGKASGGQLCSRQKN